MASAASEFATPPEPSPPTAVTTTATTTISQPLNPVKLNWEGTREALLSPDLNVALATATDLRERVEITHSATEFPSMLSTLLPAFATLLSSSVDSPRPNPDASSIEHRLRNTLLEVASRFPHNETLRPHAPLLLSLAMDVLTNDYEENAIVASRIVFDLHKNYRPMLHEYVQPFMDFVQLIYRTLPVTVHRNFLLTTVAVSTNSRSIPATATSESQSSPPETALTESPTLQDDSLLSPNPPASSSPASPGKSPSHKISAPSVTSQNPNATVSPPIFSSPSQQGMALKSTSSFRIITEFPLTVMLLFQLYPKYLKTNISQFVPLMMEALSLRPPSETSSILQSPVPPLSSSQSTTDFVTSTTVAATQASRVYTQRLYATRVRELLASQTKTLSFLTYLLRTFADQMKPYEDRLAANVVDLLSLCPTDSCSTRRELFVATRHLLATDFRKGFYKHVDALLDERVLLGTTISHCLSEQQCLIRPLAYSTLADFLHHVRLTLTMAQVSKVVHIYGKVLHDASMSGWLPIGTVQTVSVRLLRNLVDHVFHNREDTSTDVADGINGANGQLGRDLLYRILKLLVEKLGTLVEYGTEQVLRHCRNRRLKNDGYAFPPTIEMDEDVLTKKCVLRTSPDSPNSDEWINTDDSDRGNEQITNNIASLVSENEDDDDDEHRIQLDQLYSVYPGESLDTVQHVRDLIKTIMQGLKTVIWCLTNYGAQREKIRNDAKTAAAAAAVATGQQVPPPVSQTFTAPADESNEEVSSASQKITNTELDMINKLFEYGLKALKVFKPTDQDEEVDEGKKKLTNSIRRQRGQRELTLSKTKHVSSQQYREMLERFAAAFTVLDGIVFRRIVGPRMEILLDDIMEHEDVLIVPKHFLTHSQAISFDFCESLVAFLSTRIVNISPNIGGSMTSISSRGQEGRSKAVNTCTKKAVALLKLFELVFTSMSIFPKNEEALRPHLQVVVATCLRYALEDDFSAWPGNCFSLLRALFRAISGGKFEESYKELLPLLPTILNGLYRMYLATEHEPLRHAIIELSLTIPARLSSLLPHLSLLLRFIIPALKSENGELINLGLRTMEFWVDNLNPNFLYPIMSQQTTVLTELMVSLTIHLRPAPYPYGLLTLRLLGKLGGKNRRFLQESMELNPKHENGFDEPILSIECAWYSSSSVMHSDNSEMTKLSQPKEVNYLGNEKKEVATKLLDDSFALPLPLERAVEVLKLVACAPDLVAADTPSISLCDDEHDEDEDGVEPRHLLNIDTRSVGKMLNAKIEDVNLTAYCIETMEETRKSQADASFTILRCALAAILDVGETEMHNIEISDVESTMEQNDYTVESQPSDDKAFVTCRRAEEARKTAVKLLCDGLFQASLIDFLKRDSILLLKGFATHLFLILASHIKYVNRADSNHSAANEEHQAEDASCTSQRREAQVINGKIQPLDSFGCFCLSGLLQTMVNPLLFNEAIVAALSYDNECMQSTAIDVIVHLTELSNRLQSKIEVAKDSALSTQLTHEVFEKRWKCSEFFFENLLSCLCEAYLSVSWNCRSGVQCGICKLIELMGSKWARKFEVEMMHIAFFALKDSSKEIPRSERESLLFFLRVSWLLYGGPPSWNSDPKATIRDVFYLPPEQEVSPPEEPACDRTNLAPSCQSQASDAILNMLIGETASSRQLVRFAARHGLRQLYTDDASTNSTVFQDLFSKHSSTIKRLLFSRSIRTLPLPDQVGVIDALAYFIDQSPNLLSISDQHLLAFLSELLKMMTVADGEMTSDSASYGVIVNKDGYAPVPQETASTAKRLSALSHASCIFLREECVLEDNQFGGRIVVPGERPFGIQLRVSSLLLFRAIIRRHTAEFFDASPSTPIGNIKPHVINLLFRSLISKPPEAVTAAYIALRDVLSLGASGMDSRAGIQPLSHRLPKELLQTCIRPVLLNLRDYTKLTVPLLRGLTRLLSLLSSWFNKTLGEKLIDHLQKWTDPERIISEKIWKEGEEPLVAAAIIDLFELLPQAPHFVEPLVKTTIRLESVLPRYKAYFVVSPYRAPLAKYLNKHCSATASFFLTEQRLKKPIYSNLLQDVVSRDDTRALQTYFSGAECSVILLNVCFERPLAIIRSEKTTSVSNGSHSVSGAHRSPDFLSMHGIHVDTMYSNQSQKEILLRQDLQMKQSRLHAMQQVEIATKDALQMKAAAAAVAPVPDSNALVAEARLKQQLAVADLEKAQKDVSLSQQALTNELAKASEAQKTKGTVAADQATRPMTTSALELQYKGFRLVETLITKDPAYLRKHSDVVKAFRWLWRSKGRHLRLLHEDSISPRYHGESKFLAKFLVQYSEAYPNDVDVVFDLLRIFLQPSTTDFHFVKDFFEKMVCDRFSTGQKRHVMQRFFALVANEALEETKVLSIQLLILPMLKKDFEVRRGHKQSREPNCSESVMKEKKRAAAHSDSSNKTDLSADIIDSHMIQKLVKEVFLQGSAARAYGQRLYVELLKLSTLLLKYLWQEMLPHRKDLIKFAWNLLKNDDANTKQWAYVNVCRFISVYETPAKIILQVYIALLRSHQQEAKDLVRVSLDILLPILPIRLSVDDFNRAINHTHKILYEEGNSVPQLAHIWQTIVRHQSIFILHKHHFISHMVNSLNRLGLSVNSPLKNRRLAVSLVRLIFRWEGIELERSLLTSKGEGPVTLVLKKRSNSEANVSLLLNTSDESLPKKVKTGEISLSTTGGSVLQSPEAVPKREGTPEFILNQHMVDTIVNFLVRFILCVSPDNSQQKVGKQASILFKMIICCRKSSELQVKPFDKIIAMCADESSEGIASSATAAMGAEKKTKHKHSKNSGVNKSSIKGLSCKNHELHKGASLPKDALSLGMATKLKEDQCSISNDLLLACLELFCILLEHAPRNKFLYESSEILKTILGPCFTRAAKEESQCFRRKLGHFLILFFSDRSICTKQQQEVESYVKCLMERFILNAATSESLENLCPSRADSNTVLGSSTSLKIENRHSNEGRKNGNDISGGTCSAYSLCRIIEEINEDCPEFVEHFSNGLLILADFLLKSHIQTVSMNSKNMATTKQHVSNSGDRQPISTPVIAIFNEACGYDSSTSFSESVIGKLHDLTCLESHIHCISGIPPIGTGLQTLLCCLRLLSRSSILFHFSSSRKKLMTLLNKIFDLSDNIQLLMTGVIVIGRWILTGRKGRPLTLEERCSYMWKMSSLDLRGLPDVATQPLVDLVSFIALSLNKLELVSPCTTSSDANDRSYKNEDIVNMKAEEFNNSAVPVENENDAKTLVLPNDTRTDSLLSRWLVSCLLSANLSLRLPISVLYVSRGGSVNNLLMQLKQRQTRTGFFLEDSLDSFDIPGKTLTEILLLLVCSDFEGLGNRMWTAVFVDTMIATSKHLGGNIAVCWKKMNQEGSMTKSTSFTAQDTHWFAAPRYLIESDKGSQDSLSTTATVEEFGHEYFAFRQTVASYKVSSGNGRGRCLTGIRVLAQGEVNLCQDLFNHLFHSAWCRLPNDEVRLALVPSLECLLARPYHSQFLRPPGPSKNRKLGSRADTRQRRGMNVIQSLLRAISRLRPLPMIDSDILFSLAADYNCWHEVLDMLDRQNFALQENKTADAKGYQKKILSTIRRCYLELGDKDLDLAIEMNLSSFPSYKYALSLDTYSFVNDALDSYNSLIDKAESDQQAFVAENSTAANRGPSEHEIYFWEDRWVALHRELSQWSVLEDYAVSTGSSKLAMESAWKLRNWEKVRTLCAAPSIVAAVEVGDPAVKMSEIFLAIADGKLNEVENLHAQTAQLCLYKWQLLPSISSGCNAHSNLLQCFHRLVELRESGQIMVETTTHSKNKTYPDLKNLLSAWRHRLPNDFDPVSRWDDVFVWRSHMFDAITTNFSWSEPGTLATLHDRPWTAIRMSRTARKQGMKDVALLSLSNLADTAMDVSDAFAKLREQILSYKDGSELERTGGLNLVNSTNLSFFDNNQKSELFRLKAGFLDSLGGRSKANQVYCHAVQICPTYSKAWVSWGGLCSSLAELQSQAARTDDSNPETSSNAAKKISQYLAQAMGCYLEAIQCDSCEASRIHLSRCLWMLTKDGATPGILCQTLEKRAAPLPPWVWLPWIPQLLSSLCRVESRAVKVILEGIVSSIPQAVYFYLRAFYLERRDIERSRDPGATGVQSPPTAVSRSEELMTLLRKSHPTLWYTLEAVLEELIIRFRPSYEEELLATVTALLQRADSQLQLSKQRTGSSDEFDEDAVLAGFSKTLARVSVKFFRSTVDSATSVKDCRAKKTAEFTFRYKERFEKDFAMTNVTVTQGSSQHRLSLTGIIGTLKKWKILLEAQVEATPSIVPLMQTSPLLACFSSESPDMWNGACDPRSTKGLISLRLSREDTDSGLVQSSTSSLALAAAAAAVSAARAVSLAAEHEGGGGYYGGGSAVIEIPGQYAPNFSNALDCKPAPELHAKLIKFEPTFEVIRKNDQVVRRIGMVGSDGKTHRFLLQFAIPYMSRTDERTAQLHHLVGKLLRKEIISCRRHLSVQPCAVVPVAQRLRMTSDEKTHYSLEDIFKAECESRGIDSDAAANYFQTTASRLIAEQSCDSLGVSNSLNLERAAKLQAYQATCELFADSCILKRRMSRTLGSAEQMFQFRICFASQVAVNSALQYAFGANERTASKFVFNVTNARVLSPDFRLSYSHQGFLESNKMPFRMTQNIEELIGSHLLYGVFVPSLASTASSMHRNADDIDSALCLLLRDDIVSWYTSKSSTRSDSKTQELERQLTDRILKNVRLVQDRLGECSPKTPVVGEDTSDPVDNKVRSLLSIATDPENLAMMSSSYSAWL